MNLSSRLTKLFFVSFLTTGLFATGPDFSASISADGGGEQEYVLTFGFAPDATDGFDDGVDSYAPPAPPPPAFDAALGFGGERYYAQILNGSNDDLGEHQYDILLAFDSNNLINLTWDNTGWGDLMGSCLLQDAFGGMMINVDMLSAGSAAINNPAFNTLKLKVTPLAGSDEPEPIPGCMDDTACNYNSEATEDDGSCEELDCAGDCGGTAVADCAGECGGTAEEDCAGDCGGTAEEDCNGDCGGTAVADCAGECGGDSFIDCQDECVDGVILTYVGDGNCNMDNLVCPEFNCDSGDCDGIVLLEDGTCGVPPPPPPPAANLFFSEAAEGSSNNKYLEIYNGDDGDVDLSGYSLSSCSNGCDEEGVFDYPDNVSFEAGTVLSPGDVYVVCHGSASEEIQENCDQHHTYLSNGDDAYALTTSGAGSILDIIGDMGGDPGSGWEVAGVSNGTKDHTLVRKDGVASGNGGDFASSAGTNADDSEWVVLDQDDWSHLGWHIDEPAGSSWGCNDPDATNYDADAEGCEDGTIDCCDYITSDVTFQLTSTECGATWLTGTMDNWSGWGAELFDDNGDGVMTVTLSLVPSDVPYEYKYQCGGWSHQEDVPDGCALGGGETEYNNRYFVLGEADLVLDAHAWSGCAGDEPLASITITDPTHAQVLSSGDFDVAFEVENFSVGQGDDFDGHVHVYVDGDVNPYGDYMHYSLDNISLSGVPSGTHTINLSLVQPNHEHFDPSINAYVTVTVDADEPPPSGAPNFTSSVSATSNDLTMTMNFGFSPDATDGYDDGMDSYAPPAPPPPSFDAAIVWNGDRYYTQILNGSADDLVAHTYTLAFAYDTNNLIELSWDNSDWSANMSECLLQDAFGGVMINVDMLTESSLTLNNPAFTNLNLTVTPAAGAAEPETHPVTFTVVDDGNDYQDVELKGQMTDWATVDMNNDGSGSWTVTLDLEPGMYEWGAIENDGSEWGIWLPSLAGFESNPMVTVGPNGEVSGDTGFSVSCQNCSPEYSVTFQLTNTDCGSTWITGSMDNWSGWGAELFDDNGDGVLTTTMTLNASDVAYEYKYTCGGWDVVEEVPCECAYNCEWGNRGFLLTDGDLVLEAHPWSGCPGDDAPSDGPEFAVDLIASSSSGSYDLTVGFSAGATDGFDANIDDYAPPAPPPPAFDAALGWGGDRYFIQILGSSAEDFGAEHVFDVLLQYDESGSIQLNWDYSAFSSVGTFHLTDAVSGGDLVSVNMNENSHVNLDNPAVNMLHLSVTPGTYEPPPPPSVNVTFQVNMAYQDPSNGVYIRGGNIGSSLPDTPSMGYQMSDEDGDLVFDVTLPLDANAHYNYKFATGESWGWEGNWETVPADCGEGDYSDRFMDTGGEDMTLDPVCFGSCEDCADQTIEVTFNVDMSDVGASDEGVFIAGGGTFGNPGDNPMSDEDGDGVYSITFTLPANLSTDYTFINGGCGWGCKEDIGGQDCAVPPYNDRHIDLGEENATVNSCFGVCGDGFCDELTPPDFAEVTFEVDISQVDLDGFVDGDGNGFYGVYATGSFDGWAGWGTELYDDDGDGVYTGSRELAEGDHEYIFTINGWAGISGNIPVGSECDWNPDDGYGNYGFTMGTEDMVLGVVCFGSCTACEDEPQPTDNLFFSEAAEGSSNNKYLEVYNAGDAAVDLSGYAFPSVSNAPSEPGMYEYWNTFSEGATVEAGDVYVICHGSADDFIQGECDQAHTYLSNGDDGYCLVGGTEDNFSILDCVGDWNGDPGSGWEVAGVSNATKDHTLVRKDDVASGNGGDWPSSAGTNADDSEWVVLDQNDWSHLGWHIDEPAGPSWGCNDPDANNYDPDSDGCEDGTTDCCVYPVLPTEMSIYDIQGQADASPHVDVLVSTSGTVTGKTSSGFWMQDGSGPWSGVWCYQGSDSIAVGDNVTVVGTVIEYYDLTEIIVDEVAVNSSGNAAPEPAALQTGVFEEEYESVVVSATGECDNNDLGYGEWSIDDGTGPGRVDDKMYADSTIAIGNHYTVAGPLDFGYGNFKIQPRDAGDITDVTPEPPSAPSNLSATAGEESVSLEWDAIADNGGSRDLHGFQIQVDVSGDGQSITLATGFDEAATDGYDDGIDAYAPPAPPPPAFDAALGWGGDRYYTQMLAADSDYSEHVVDVQLAYGADGCVTASWDNTGWSELGTFYLKDAFGGMMIDEDMTAVGTLQSCNSAFTQLKLHMTPFEVLPPPPPPAGTPDFMFTMNASGGVVPGSYDLTIGFSPDATDGYDEATDAFAPPSPPPPAFDAALMWEGDRYYSQVLNGSMDDVGVEHVFDVALQYDSDNLISLSWDNGGLSDLGTFVLQDAFGGMMINVDMTEVGSLEMNNPAFNTLKLIVTPAEGGSSEDPTFNVYRDGGLAAEGVSGTSYTDAPLAADVQVCYTVTQNLGDGSESAHSNEACATPIAVPVPGCTDDSACNYDEGATDDDGSCYYENTVDCYDDADGDGYWNDMASSTGCDADCADLGDSWSDSAGSGPEVLGCTDAGAMNYDPEATEDDGTCAFDITISADLSSGWNWVSINVEGDDQSVGAVLESLGESGSFIKNQTSFAAYYGPDWGWIAEGGLTEVGVESMYMINMSSDGTLSYTGTPVDPSDTPIALSTGWNWIGYTPQTENAVADALSSIGESGSFIKNQTSFAAYYGPDWGWIAEGGLTTLAPLDGYMINMSEDATLTYTSSSGGDLARTVIPDFSDSPWEVDYRKFEHNMSVTGVMVVDEEESVDTEDIIAVFVGEECRGIASPVYHPVADRYTVGLMIYGNEKDEKLTFGVYDAGTGEIKELSNSILFEANATLGNGLNPVIFRTVSIPAEYAVSQNFPNPFNPVTNIRFDLPEQSDVSVAVFNARGQLVNQLTSEYYPAGSHMIQWNGTDLRGLPVSSGVYIYSVKAGEFHAFKKMLLVK